MYFYPRPPRGGRHVDAPVEVDIPDISIHALREEGDHLRVLQAQDQTISIHALREEGDRKPCTMPTFRSISIHALREEGDFCFLPLTITYTQFLSTPSARRATAFHRSDHGQQPISIHALREEGD